MSTNRSRNRKRTPKALRAQKKRHNLVYGTIAVVVALAAVAAIVSQRDAGSSNTSSTPQTQPVVVTGAALPTYTGDGTDPAIGKTIPTVAGRSFDGTPIVVANDGKPKVLLFVAHWCPHCQREVPLLAPDLRSHPLPKGVEMVTISTGVNASAPNYPPSAWLARVHWPTPIMADDAQSDAANALGLSAYPYFVFVDANNRVVARTSGEITLTQFRAYVAQLATAA